MFKDSSIVRLLQNETVGYEPSLSYVVDEYLETSR